MLKHTPKNKLTVNLLRILFQCLWEVRALRPLLRRFWPAMQLEVGGHLFLLHPADNYTERFMWRKGLRVEAASIGRLTLLVAGKRALIFDIGANCGSFTLPLAAAAGEGSRVVAFEPNVVMSERLRTNLALNGLTHRVEVTEIALGETDGNATLYLVERNLGQSSLRLSDSARSIPVAVRRLEHFLPDQRQRFETFVIKIDVEGLEDEVLIPFLTSIPAPRMPDAILIETDSADIWGTDLRGALRQKGYRPVFIGEEQNTLFLRIDGVPEQDR